ncbi:MAG: helix-turn-helix transcriptional regulator, partial [Candidatus Methanomethylophilaceae archaeon]|nr:helix-turn-helix transcriptional regulator [Candidatus Methanomethylophilaceae archaeon]
MNRTELSDIRRNFRSRLRQKIRELRAERTDTVTLEDMAKEIGISYRYLSEMLNRDTNVSLEVLLALTDYFGVSVDWMLGLDDGDGGGLPLSEDAVARLDELASGDPGHSPLPDDFNPPQLRRDETGRRFPDVGRTLYPGGSTQEERAGMQAEGILETLSLIIEDEKLPALLDAYLHSVWGRQVRYRSVAEAVKPYEVDLVLASMIVDRLDAIRIGREGR